MNEYNCDLCNGKDRDCEGYFEIAIKPYCAYKFKEEQENRFKQNLLEKKVRAELRRKAE